MNYYQPRQREDNGLWHYTCRNDDRVWPVAGCSPFVNCPECEGRSFYTVEDCAHCDNHGVVRGDDPCPGHDTPEEARRHAAEHVIEHTRYDSGFSNWSSCEAKDCDEPTKKAAQTGHPNDRNISLCDAHLNRETVTQIVGDELGDIISSS